MKIISNTDQLEKHFSHSLQTSLHKVFFNLMYLRLNDFTILEKTFFRYEIYYFTKKAILLIDFSKIK